MPKVIKSHSEQFSDKISTLIGEHMKPSQQLQLAGLMLAASMAAPNYDMAPRGSSHSSLSGSCCTTRDAKRAKAKAKRKAKKRNRR